MIDTNAIKTNLQKFCDPEYSGYLGDVPNTTVAISRAIDGWADALENGFIAITPVSSSLIAAVAAFKTAAVFLIIAVYTVFGIV